MFATICTNCDARLNAPDDVEGKRVKCKKCDEPFVVHRIEAATKPPKGPPPLPPELEPAPRRPTKTRPQDEDEKFRRRSKSRPAVADDEDDEPRRPSRHRGDGARSGPSPILFAFLGAGILFVLAGAAGGIYYHYSAKALLC